jgi:photosystem II stability/assembly factor-like uncharacterized protein
MWLAMACWLVLAAINTGSRAGALETPWQAIGPSEQDVLGVAQSPFDPQTLLVATRASGIYRSVDGGESWQAARPNLTLQGAVTWIGFDPSRHMQALALVNGRPYLSRDGGRTWRQAGNGLPVGADLTTADFPVWGHVVFAAGGNGLYRSPDGGNTWQPLTNGLSTARTITFIVSSPIVPGRMLLGVSYNEIHGGRVFRSDNAGASWQEIDHGLSPDRLPWAAVWSSTSPNTAWVASGNVYRTDDGGRIWHPDGLGLPAPPSIQALAPLGTTGLVAVAAGAVYVRPSLRSGWLPHPVPWPAVAPVHAALSLASGGVILATGGGLYLLLGATLEWQDLGVGLPSSAPIYSLATDGSSIYAGGDSAVWQRDSLGGWEATGGGIPTGADVHALLVLPGPPRRLLCATDYGIYATFAGSDHWTIVPGPLAGHGVGALTYAPATAMVYASSVQGGIYAAPASSLDWRPLPGSFQLGAVHMLATSGDGAWLLANDSRAKVSGHTWQPTGLAGTLAALAVGQIPPVLIAGTAARGLYRSTDAGRTWTRVTGIPASANVPLLARTQVADGSLVYALVNQQVLVSADAGSTWHPVAPAPPGTLLTSLAGLSGTPVQVLAGSTGSGIFQLGVNPPLPVPSATPTSTPSLIATATDTVSPVPATPTVSTTPRPRPTPGSGTATATSTATPSPTASSTPTPTMAAPAATPTWTATAAPRIR